MKKTFFFLLQFFFAFVIGVIGFITWNNRTLSTITLDINPSIEIQLDKKDNVKKIIALNDEANEIINKNIKGKSLEKTFELLITNLVEKGYADEKNNINIIIYANGKLTNEEVSKKVEIEFGKKEIHTEIIVIEKITKKDEKLAKKYNISPAKVAYIKTIVKDNENMDIKDFVNKSISELSETKERGKYCDSDYILEGDWCLKEKERIAALDGMVCPPDYTEYEGKCFEEVNSVETNNYGCNDEFELVDGECVLEEIYDAMGKCDSGDYDRSSGYCEKNEIKGDAEEYCRLTPETDILMDHKCYGPKPILNGGCANNEKIINGKCVDLNVYYESDWICRNGGEIMYLDRNEDHKCYEKVKTEPKSYYCEGEGKLNGTKCLIKKTKKAMKDRICPSETTPIDDGSRCINLNKTTDKVPGFVCEGENARLRGNNCILYDIVEAKTS